MRRLAAPAPGGMITALLLSIVVLSAIFSRQKSASAFDGRRPSIIVGESNSSDATVHQGQRNGSTRWPVAPSPKP